MALCNLQPDLSISHNCITAKVCVYLHLFNIITDLSEYLLAPLWEKELTQAIQPSNNLFSRECVLGINAKKQHNFRH